MTCSCISNAFDHMGYYVFPIGEDKPKEIQFPELAVNFLNAWSYLPYLGTAVGVVRLVGSTSFLYAVRNSETPKASLITSIARGAFEVAFPASRHFLVLPDIIVTIVRKYQKTAEESPT